MWRDWAHDNRFFAHNPKWNSPSVKRTRSQCAFVYLSQAKCRILRSRSYYLVSCPCCSKGGDAYIQNFMTIAPHPRCDLINFLAFYSAIQCVSTNSCCRFETALGVCHLLLGFWSNSNAILGINYIMTSHPKINTFRHHPCSYSFIVRI